MMQTRTSSASKIRDIAQEFLDQHEGTPFQRKELEEYVDSKINVSTGSKTGALNRFLIENGVINGIQQVRRGVYLYDAAAKFDKPAQKNINERLIKIMDKAFEEAKELIDSIKVSDMLADNDVEKPSRYRKLLGMKNEIDQLLKK